MDKYLNVYYDAENNKVFRYDFPSLQALVNYLKTTPVNHAVFGECPSSEMVSPHKIAFAGEPLEDALEHVLYGYDQDYQKIKDSLNFYDLKFDIATDVQRSRTYRSYVGSRVDMPAYVNGSPKNMRRLKRYEDRKMVNFYFQLSYISEESQNQIASRGIIALHLIKALEQMGYQVNLQAFSLDYEKLLGSDKKEILYNSIHLKEFDVQLNEAKCVGPFVRKEFLRRIIFRLLEVTDVSDCWKRTYGRPFKEEETKSILHLNPDDIFFGQAYELGILGNDLLEDYQHVIEKFNLQDGISLSKRLK